MPEIEVDPLTGLRTILAPERSNRPGAFLGVEPAAPIDPAGDPFAPGNEDRTPPELFAVRPDGSAPNTPGWKVRVVPNLYPALSPNPPQPERHANTDLYFAQPAMGAHEVIINAPDPVACLADLEAAQVVEAVGAWRERMRSHAEAACVHLIVNERVEAGASLPHTHAQLYAFDFVPAAIARERDRFGAYAVQTMGGNLLGDLLQEEVRHGKRIVAIDREAVALAPYAARVPYQLMIVPRTPRPRFEDEGPTAAALLYDVLRRLAHVLGASPPLNMWIRTAPRTAERFCWRIDVLPRLAHMAGLELGAGVHLNPIAPEAVAEQLRDAA